METPEEKQIHDDFTLKVNHRVDQLLEEVESVSSFLSEVDNGDWICPVGTTVRLENYIKDESLREADHAFIRVLCRELQSAKDEIERLKRESLEEKERIEILVQCCNRQTEERDILVKELEHVRSLIVEQKETIVELLTHVTRLTETEMALKTENEKLDNDVTQLLKRVEDQNENDHAWAEERDQYEVFISAQSEQLVELSSANNNLQSQIVLLETLNNQAHETAAHLQERLLWFCDIKQQLISEQIYNMKIAVVQMIDERDSMSKCKSAAKDVLNSVDEVIANLALYLRSMEERNGLTRRRINDVRWSQAVEEMSDTER